MRAHQNHKMKNTKIKQTSTHSNKNDDPRNNNAHKNEWNMAKNQKNHCSPLPPVIVHMLTYLNNQEGKSTNQNNHQQEWNPPQAENKNHISHQALQGPII